MHRGSIKFDSRGQFAGHETFPLRLLWLKKAYDAVGDGVEVAGEFGQQGQAIVAERLIRGIDEHGVEEGVNRAAQAGQRLNDLKAFVADVYQQEQGGKRFSPEEADLLGAEAQNRATAIAGQLTQLSAQLNVPLQGQ